MDIQEHDVVKLKDGKEGTVVHIYTKPGRAFLIELSDQEGEMLTVQQADIAEIVWKVN
jgi:hypothetical protein